MQNGFDADALADAVTPATRAMIINSPVNPTGAVLSARDISQLAKIAEENDLWIIFDQVYADMAYGGPVDFPQSLPHAFERTMVVDSLSKSFGMTGWRLGYLAMPPGVAKFIVKFIQHSIYCVPPFIQAAGVRALSLSDELLPRYRSIFETRVSRACEALEGLEGMKCTMPDAGFFLFPKVEGDEVAIARRWLDVLNIAVLPGTAFGDAGAGYLRMSLSCSDEDLDTALERIAGAGVAC
jgi:aspartate aminotransferase